MKKFLASSAPFLHTRLIKHEPYNKLLNSLFPADSDFVVSLQFAFFYEVLLVNKPVLVLQVKPLGDLYIQSNLASGCG